MFIVLTRAALAFPTARRLQQTPLAQLSACAPSGYRRPTDLEFLSDEAVLLFAGWRLLREGGQGGTDCACAPVRAVSQACLKRRTPPVLRSSTIRFALGGAAKGLNSVKVSIACIPATATACGEGPQNVCGLTQGSRLKLVCRGQYTSEQQKRRLQCSCIFFAEVDVGQQSKQLFLCSLPIGLLKPLMPRSCTLPGLAWTR